MTFGFKQNAGSDISAPRSTFDFGKKAAVRLKMTPMVHSNLVHLFFGELSMRTGRAYHFIERIFVVFWPLCTAAVESLAFSAIRSEAINNIFS